MSDDAKRIHVPIPEPASLIGFDVEQFIMAYLRANIGQSAWVEPSDVVGEWWIHLTVPNAELTGEQGVVVFQTYERVGKIVIRVRKGSLTVFSFPERSAVIERAKEMEPVVREADDD